MHSPEAHPVRLHAEQREASGGPGAAMSPRSRHGCRETPAWRRSANQRHPQTVAPLRGIAEAGRACWLAETLVGNERPPPAAAAPPATLAGCHDDLSFWMAA